MLDSVGGVPCHVAIILDGNGRWAASRSLDRVEGHRAGAENIRDILETSVSAGVRFLTLFCFSSENWRRSDDEVSALFGLLDYYLHSWVDDLVGSNIRLRVIGSRAGLPAAVVDNIVSAERLTEGCDGLYLQAAFNYGGRWDICDAVRRVASSVKCGDLAIDAIDEDLFGSYLSTFGVPDPDLLIRSGGELRLSNFMLWQLAYSELIFVDKLWPSFSRDDFAACLREYSCRVRRFGC